MKNFPKISSNQILANFSILDASDWLLAYLIPNWVTQSEIPKLLFFLSKKAKLWFDEYFENIPHYYLGSAFFKNLGVTMKGGKGGGRAGVGSKREFLHFFVISSNIIEHTTSSLGIFTTFFVKNQFHFTKKKHVVNCSK